MLRLKSSICLYMGTPFPFLKAHGRFPTPTFPTFQLDAGEVIFSEEHAEEHDDNDDEEEVEAEEEVEEAEGATEEEESDVEESDADDGAE